MSAPSIPTTLEELQALSDLDALKLAAQVLRSDARLARNSYIAKELDGTMYGALDNPVQGLPANCHCVAGALYQAFGGYDEKGYARNGSGPGELDWELVVLRADQVLAEQIFPKISIDELNEAFHAVGRDPANVDRTAPAYPDWVRRRNSLIYSYSDYVLSPLEPQEGLEKAAQLYDAAAAELEASSA